mmetsp:Transcript_127152/g.219986  ORF Transcript_127152/g.219986 Transcript_127152/m.219986 type:complete len:203 (+) Transcript_127152:938-1546(+)
MSSNMRLSTSSLLSHVSCKCSWISLMRLLSPASTFISGSLICWAAARSAATSSFCFCRLISLRSSRFCSRIICSSFSCSWRRMFRVRSSTPDCRASSRSWRCRIRRASSCSKAWFCCAASSWFHWLLTALTCASPPSSSSSSSAAAAATSPMDAGGSWAGAASAIRLPDDCFRNDWAWTMVCMISSSSSSTPPMSRVPYLAT